MASTVSEMIKILNKLDPNARVGLWTGFCCSMPHCQTNYHRPQIVSGERGAEGLYCIEFCSPLNPQSAEYREFNDNTPNGEMTVKEMVLVLQKLDASAHIKLERNDLEPEERQGIMLVGYVEPGRPGIFALIKSKWENVSHLIYTREPNSGAG